MHDKLALIERPVSGPRARRAWGIRFKPGRRSHGEVVAAVRLLREGARSRPSFSVAALPALAF